MSLIVLFRCATGEGWNNIMRELAVTEDDLIEIVLPNGDIRIDRCVPNQTYEHFKLYGPQSCGDVGAYIFFMIFIVTI